MPLVDVRGFNLSPGIGNKLLQGAQTVGAFDKLGEQLATRKREDQVRTLLGQAQQPAPSLDQGPVQPVPSREELIQQSKSIDPAIAQDLIKKAGLDEGTRLAEASRFAANLESTPFEQRREKIIARANELQSQNRNADDTIELLDMDEAQQNKGLLGVQLLDLNTKDRLKLRGDAVKAKSDAIKLTEVKSSKILDNGTIVSVLKSGDTKVTSPDGTILEGDERTKAIVDAQEFGISIQQRRAKSRALGSGAGKIALNGFDQAGKIKENISDLKRGIDLIEKEGATTGFVQDFLPNMRASTRKFANLRRKLGLNVVASVTFGALSEGELKLAMDVALPDGISPKETVKWIKERIAAQEKLATNLEDAALYLADHSVADLIRRNRGMKAAAKKKEKINPSASGTKVGRFTVEIE